MSDKLKPTDDLEELSLLLDEINAGRQPECDNDEIVELLAIATLIKKDGGLINPPQHLLDQTVERALAGIQADNPKPKPSRFWWYSGTLSTAVAVLLVVGLNMLPSWKQQTSMVIPPHPTASQQQETIQTTSDKKQPLIASQTPLTEQPQSVNTIQPEKKQIPAAEPQQPKAVAPLVPPTDLAKSPNKANILAEESPRMSMAKSAYSPSDLYSTAAKSTSPTLTPLTIPGQVPDLVITDSKQGVLRQVYNKGTTQELTITQRLQPQDTASIQATSSPPTTLKTSDYTPATLNIVRVTIADQEVTLEGRQTRQELLKLAESLIP